jgi:hypothetical protein
MTAIFHPDCRAVSRNGAFILEALSPHNGTVNHRDGGRATDDEFGSKYHEHQSHFRYQLLHAGSGKVLWERWQPKNEDSSHEVIVSDGGWSILRTHGFRPEVIAISPTGTDAIRSIVTGFRPLAGDAEDAEGGNVYRWQIESYFDSTAGFYWSSGSWRFFF